MDNHGYGKQLTNHTNQGAMLYQTKWGDGFGSNRAESWTRGEWLNGFHGEENAGDELSKGNKLNLKMFRVKLRRR